MNILFVEEDLKIINQINREFNQSNHSFILLNNHKKLKVLLKNSKYIDLIITSLDFTDLNCFEYLKMIRDINKDISIVVLSSNDFTFSVKSIVDLKIDCYIDKNNFLGKLKSILNLLDYKIQSERLNKTFKEFSFYSETDLNGNIIEVSDSLCELTGYRKEQLIGQKHSILKHPNDEYIKYQDLWKTIISGNSWCGELQINDKSGNSIWYRTIIFPKMDSCGKIVAYGAKRQDITDKIEFERLSMTDSLTGLHNRRYFDKIFKNEINRAKRIKEDLILMIIDIDKFKLYNDYYGHLNADEVLKKIANILQMNYNRANDFIFRLCKEEFAILTSSDNSEKALLYVEKMRKEIENTKINHIKTENKILTISIGIFVLRPEDNFTENEIYDFADIALYKAKKALGNKVIIYK
ncbi:response regulator receiver-modulated diguanylate cyclase (PAS domain) [Aliarcobacter faecis]|uniref:GGDEF domain-containing response regulator n=1 Tax=Aliarcobacter faecis TaxID=1564138 RepID=UPI0004B02205|nr:diguanylate cyclase [Aliarcobacter faecis]QKF73773.1 response regulator receiver-modulated diguanylate cyclase (PAS domain) [Aliarcobacter faecis]